MRTFSYGLLILTSVLCSCATSPVASQNASKTPYASNTPRVANDKSINPSDKSINSLGIGKVEVSRTGIITAQVENPLREPIKVWQDSNSWVAACWRVLLIRSGRVETFFQNPDQGFTINVPTFNEIAGGGHIEQKLDLNGGNWCGMGHCSIYNQRGFGGEKISFESNDIVIVVYDVPDTQEARDIGVWYGVIAATANIQDGKASDRSSIRMNGNEKFVLPVEKSINALRISNALASRTGFVTLQLENFSQEPLKVWKGSNSWGAACWRVFLIRNGTLEVFFQNRDQEFTKNGPGFNEIPGGGHLDQKLDLNGGNWCGLGHCSIYNQRGFGGKILTFEPNDTVIVIYDVPVTQEARDNRVWYGVIAATATVQ